MKRNTNDGDIRNAADSQRSSDPRSLNPVKPSSRAAFGMSRNPDETKRPCKSLLGSAPSIKAFLISNALHLKEAL